MNTYQRQALAQIEVQLEALRRYLDKKEADVSASTNTDEKQPDQLIHGK